MTLKIVLLALVLLGAWFVLFRPRPKAPRKPPSPPSAALEACPRCGVYRLPGGQCACDRPSTTTG